MAVGGGAGIRTTSTRCRQVYGGGVGAVGILNNLSVTPGQTLTYNVGAGGAGNNDGGDTSFNYAGVNYVAGGGKTSTSVAINSLAVYERKAGGAGGTTTGAFTISKAGGQGGDSYRYNLNGAVVGGGGGGAGAGAVGGPGQPFNTLLDYNNAETSPYNWTTSTTGTILCGMIKHVGGIRVKLE